MRTKHTSTNHKGHAIFCHKMWSVSKGPTQQDLDNHSLYGKMDDRTLLFTTSIAHRSTKCHDINCDYFT